jgi:hypothetical protein
LGGSHEWDLWGSALMKVHEGTCLLLPLCKETEMAPFMEKALRRY